MLVSWLGFLFKIYSKFKNKNVNGGVWRENVFVLHITGFVYLCQGTRKDMACSKNIICGEEKQGQQSGKDVFLF